MKYLIVLTAMLYHLSAAAQDLKTEYLFELTADLNQPEMVGNVGNRMRVIYPVTGGTVKGPKINGKITSTSGDWGMVMDSTTFKLDVRLTILTDDGAYIYVSYGGYIHADAKTFAGLTSGTVDASKLDFYFRTNPVFETGSPKYAWLNHTIAVGVGRLPTASTVAYKVYAIK
jgi:Protein of unknown function (DUF3237)